MTCNPHWAEIVRRLNRGQTAFDRPDITNQVFHEKLAHILNWIMHGGLRSSDENGVKEDLDDQQCVFKLHVIEFQKRGLPHAHIAVKMFPEPTTISQLNSVVSATFPQYVDDSGDGLAITEQQRKNLKHEFYNQKDAILLKGRNWISPKFRSAHETSSLPW